MLYRKNIDDTNLSMLSFHKISLPYIQSKHSVIITYTYEYRNFKSITLFSDVKKYDFRFAF